jgi:hypothetical protein
MTVKEDEVAVVKTKFTVGTASDESEPEGEEGNMFNLKAKMTGGGEGTTQFSVGTGRTRSANNKLNVKINATMDSPQGGDPLEFEATLKFEQENEIGE